MYTVDRPGIERLKAVFALMAKLSGIVMLFEHPGGLEMVAENTSQTVQTRAFLVGSSTARSKASAQVYTLKASILDKIFSTISPIGLMSCTIELGEHLTVRCVYGTLKRSHRIDFLEPAEIIRGPAVLRGAHALVLRVDMLKIILSHFSASAEMVELWLDEAGGVRWRGYRNPQRATREEMYLKIDSTAAMHYTEMLQGLRAVIPWRAEFKLKELRHAAMFFEKVCKDGEFCCIFDEPGSPLSLCTGGGGFSYCIQFATRNRPLNGGNSQEIKWQLAPTEFILAPEMTETTRAPSPAASPSPPGSPVRLAPPVKAASLAASPIATADTSMQESLAWEAINPHAEIPATQQERPKGLFD